MNILHRTACSGTFIRPPSPIHKLDGSRQYKTVIQINPWCVGVRKHKNRRLTIRMLWYIAWSGQPFWRMIWSLALRWRHNERDNVSNHQPHDCLLNRLIRPRSKKTSKLRVTGLCAGNSPGTGEFPAQMASNAENVSIWWRHHEAVACAVGLIIFLWQYTSCRYEQWKCKLDRRCVKNINIVLKHIPVEIMEWIGILHLMASTIARMFKIYGLPWGHKNGLGAVNGTYLKK